MWWASEVTAKSTMPTSMPTVLPVGSRGFAGTSSQDKTTNHLRPSRFTEIALTRRKNA